jgi:site-specific DNA-methyltransferase (adenine-specific)
MLINNDCLLALDELEENSVDAIVTDPPYELNFMGKGWDNAGISFSKDTWAKCLRVLKPGGYMLAFGGSRTYHRIACAIEDGGFEIRDCIMWLYGSGFPKSMNIGLAIDKKNGVESKIVGKGKSGGTSRAYQSPETTTAGEYQVKEAQNEWAGWGTALKPSYEPIVVARKPLDGSCVANVMKWDVGGLNIDECRVGDEVVSIHNAPTGSFAGGEYGRGSDTESYRSSTGRFPANTILDNQDGEEWRRYFYCAKASKKDRDEGLEEFEEDTTDDGRKKPIDNPYLRGWDYEA